MKALVIGATGQIGSELLKQAAEFAIDAIGLRHSEFDITNMTELTDVLDRNMPNIVVNTAAFHVVSECEKNPQEAIAVNAIAVGRLAEASQKRNIRFVSYSTDYVFDGKKRSGYVEKDTPHPLQWYGISKLAGEHALLTACPNKGVIIRTNGVYGGIQGSRSKGGNFVLSILRDAKKTAQLEVSDRERVNPTSAKHVASATWQLLQHDVSGVYHLACEGSCSWAEFAQAILEEAGRTTQVKPVLRSEALRRPQFSVLKNTRAAKLGIVLPHWRDALHEYMQEVLENT